MFYDLETLLVPENGPQSAGNTGIMEVWTVSFDVDLVMLIVSQSNGF